MPIEMELRAKRKPRTKVGVAGGNAAGGLAGAAAEGLQVRVVAVAVPDYQLVGGDDVERI
jgi:hypothetical protein